ncbi:hypothetical protein [Phyllobacterium sp. K27]
MTDQRPSNDVKRTGTEARQGSLGKPILLVLVSGLLLTLIAWGGAELFGESTDDNATVTEQENPAAGQNKAFDQATPPSGDQPTSNAPAENARPQTGSGGSTQVNPSNDTPQ